MADHGTVTREKLIELYVNDPHASMQAVADKLGVHRSTIAKAVKRFGLPTKSVGPAPGVEIPELSDREWLAKQLKDKTLRQLAQELGTTVGRIADRAYRHGIIVPSTKKSQAVRDGLRKRYPNGRRGEDTSNWQGGRRKGGAGYIYVYKPDHPKATKSGYVMEHRLVMEEKLGRYLEDDEIVHHADGDKQNNAPDNLELKSNGDHIREHFEASHEVKAWRKRADEQDARISKLEKEVAFLKAELEKLRS